MSSPTAATISNANTDNGIGVVIDTTAGNIVASTGFSSTGSIDVGGSGTSKRGIVIQGGNTFYGPITLTDLIATSTLTGTSTTAQSSAVIVQGDGSAAFLLTQGTKVTSNILLGGGGILQNASVNSTASNSIIVDLDGTLNGNLFLSRRAVRRGSGHDRHADPGRHPFLRQRYGEAFRLYLPIFFRRLADQCGDHLPDRHGGPSTPAATIRKPAAPLSSAAASMAASSIPVPEPPSMPPRR